eukprot:CAMPEP_0197001542 /NCGR_PEP_ID=MMETSP1380-20130617/6216_1 /TAXON_ID=5936 /ORGANISM="Euplotes crassus, Strain CT5" /LENGTH=248 /DNA_ID=CAMNT_0042419247 /DNA_START=332 /DNA_END=1078 /DNA_ORIENTATION=+
MKRFNQYLNGERELELKTEVVVPKPEQEELANKKGQDTQTTDQQAQDIPQKDEKPQPNEFGEIGYIETGEEQKIAIDAGNSRPYTDFFDEFVPNTTKESERAHKYTVSLHRCICYQEVLDLYQKFQYARFDEVKTKTDFMEQRTNSCLFDPKDPAFRSTKTVKDETRRDEGRVFKDEGIYPEYYGTYYMHHRIDGKLVACSILDITEHNICSELTFYDPAYSGLCLGHVTAVREMEYMRKIRKEFNNN